MLKTKEQSKPYSPMSTVEYGEFSPRSKREIHDILSSIRENSGKVQQQAITIDSEENSFRISIGDIVLASGGLQILCGGKKYTTVKSEIIPDEKLKGKAPTIYFLKFDPISDNSTISNYDMQIEKYSLKSSDNVIEAIITFQNLKKFGQILIRLDFINKIEGCSTGAYNRPCIDLFYTNKSNLSNILAFKTEEYPKPYSKFDFVESPIMLFNNDLDTLMIGPSENPHLFVAYAEKKDPTKHHLGIEGLVDLIPENFAFELLIVPGKGLVSSWLLFGDRFMMLHNRTQRTAAYGSVSQNYLGYSTMEGSAYFGRTEKDLDILQTLMLIKEEANLFEIPYLYYSLGTWFYPKKDGLLKWDANYEEIPGGTANLQETLQSGIIAAFSWFSFNTLYKTESNQWIDEVLMEKKKEIKRSLPLGSDVWTDIIETSKKWNCYTLEIEDLSEIFEFFTSFKKNVSLFIEFLKILCDVCIAHEFKIIVSKTPANFIPLFSMFSPIIQAVVCENYSYSCSCSEKITDALGASLYLWAFGIWPTKNAAFSMHKERQSGKKESRVPYPFDLLVSSLLSGAIALGDKAGAQNAELILQTCREDGLLLKPDRPLLPVELMLLDHNKPYIATTYSINSGKIWEYVLALKIDDNPSTECFYTLKDLGINGGTWVYYDYFDKLVIPIDSNTKLGGYGQYNQLKKKGDYHYGILAPVYTNGIAFIGLRDKFITVPNAVIQSVEEIADGLVIKGSYCPNKDFSLVIYSEKSPKSVTFNDTPIIAKWGEYYRTVTLTMWLTDSENFEIVFKV